MPSQSWQILLAVAQIDGTAVTGIAEGSLIPAQAKFTLPANFLEAPGKTLRIRAAGRISNVAAPGTITFRLKFGSTVVAAPAAVTMVSAVKTNVPWELSWEFTTRAVGAAANLMHIGAWRSESALGSAAGVASTVMVSAAPPAVGANFDSTLAHVVDLAAIFNTTGNSIQAHQYVLESSN